MFDYQVEQIEARLKLTWNDVTPIAWDNVPFKPRRGESFIVPETSQVDSILVAGEIGNGAVYREAGLIMIRVLTPYNKGAMANFSLIDKLEEIYRAINVNGVRMKAPYNQVIGQHEEWFQVNFFCPFDYDVKT